MHVNLERKPVLIAHALLCAFELVLVLLLQYDS